MTLVLHGQDSSGAAHSWSLTVKQRVKVRGAAGA